MENKSKLTEILELLKEVQSKDPKFYYSSENKAIIKRLKNKSTNREQRIKDYNRMGDKFIAGQGVAKDCQRALNFYLKACELENADAQYITALILRDHAEDLSEKSLKLDFKEFLEKSRKNGNLKANNFIANYYLYGLHGYKKDEVFAFKLLQYSASKKDHDGMLNLAMCYFQGQGIAKDIKAAFELYQKILLDHKNEKMYTKLGICYETGGNLGQDFSKAVKCYTNAITKTDDPFAKYLLACCIQNGRGIVKDESKAIELLKEAAAQGCKEAQQDLGAVILSYQEQPGSNEYKLIQEHCQNIGNDVDAWNMIKKAAQKKDRTAMYRLGKKYIDRNDPEHDDKLAFHYLLTAAEANLPEAQYEVGQCFFNGIGIMKNDLRAFEWFLKAEANGHLLSNYHLALCYMDGKGTFIDYKKARSHVEILVKTGDLHAKNLLVQFYQNGLGIPQDLKKAFLLLKEIVDADKTNQCVQAKYNYAMYYIMGEGVEKDLKRGFELLVEVEATGQVPLVYHQLSLCYRDGIGTDIDDKKYFECLKLKTGTSSSVEDHLALACLYLQGKGTPKNPEKAFVQYQAAASLGSLEAHNHLAFCHLEGIGTKRNKKAAVEIWSNLVASLNDSNLKDSTTSKQTTTNPTLNLNLNPKILDKYNNIESVPDIISNLGWCYLNGLGVEEDFKKAFQYFQQAYELGSLLANNHLGLCYLNGWGVDVDREKAIQLLKFATVQKQGITPVVDLKSTEETKTIIEQKTTIDTNTIAEQNKKSDTKATKESNHLVLGIRHGLNYSQVINHGKKHSQFKNTVLYHIGQLYQHGYCGADSDYKQAFEYYSNAADTCQSAQLDLAVCYLHGCGITQNIKTAFDMLFKLHQTDPHRPDVAAWLGHCYMAGDGVQKDMKKGFELIEIAANNKDYYGQFCLARCYEMGEMVKIDKERAVELYKQSSEQGYCVAQFNLGCLLDEKESNKTSSSGGNDLKNDLRKDFTQAIHYYDKAAQLGYVSAHNNIGCCFEEMYKETPKMIFAFSRYKKAAFNGQYEGMLNLARCYEEGLGTDKDPMAAEAAYDSAKELQPKSIA